MVGYDDEDEGDDDYDYVRMCLCKFKLWTPETTPTGTADCKSDRHNGDMHTKNNSIIVKTAIAETCTRR